MEDVDPSKQAHLCYSFHALAQNITEGLFASQAAATDGHWTTRD